MVATQVTMEDDGSGLPEYRLVVGVDMTKRMREALLALWCLWLWHQHLNRRDGIGFNKTNIKRVMSRKNGVPSPLDVGFSNK